MSWIVRVCAIVTIMAFSSAFAKTTKGAKNPNRKVASDIAETEMRDKRSAKLAKLLNGRSLVCKPTGRSKDQRFPLTIKLETGGGDRTSISVIPKRGSFAGSGEYLTVEYSRSWMIFRDGDDGWNQLFLNIPLDDDADLPFEPENSFPGGLFSFMRGDGAMTNTIEVGCEVR